MLTIKTLKQLFSTSMPLQAFAEFVNMVLLDEQIEKTDEEVKFFDYFGGDFHLVETVEDLSSILFDDWSESDCITSKSIVERNPGSIDIAQWNAHKTYVTLASLTNNAGGDSYLIPAEIVAQCPNIELLIADTKNWHAEMQAENKD